MGQLFGKLYTFVEDVILFLFESFLFVSAGHWIAEHPLSIPFALIISFFISAFVGYQNVRFLLPLSSSGPPVSWFIVPPIIHGGFAALGFYLVPFSFGFLFPFTLFSLIMILGAYLGIRYYVRQHPFPAYPSG